MFIYISEDNEQRLSRGEYNFARGLTAEEGK